MNRVGLFLIIITSLGLGFAIGRRSGEEPGKQSKSVQPTESRDGGSSTIDSSENRDENGRPVLSAGQNVDKELLNLNARLGRLTVPYSSLDPLEVGRVLLKAEQILSQADEGEIIELMSTWEIASVSRELVDLVYARLTEISPNLAATALLEQYRDSESLRGAGGLFKEWVSRDPQAALNWVEANATAETKNELLGACRA